MSDSDNRPIEQVARELSDNETDRETLPAVGPSHIHVTVWLDREPEVFTDLAPYLTRAALDRVIEAIDAAWEAEAASDDAGEPAEEE